ncbi:hypothetical protein TorRG33x02_071940 [Trema orientale]|uniref:Uncharacterized protein n=1 Tax=Trema orientale TaxID=63057 RepID=A0A2P5FH79_TREOI|nr:hypothetical protein TorRG33x02_071940 [Trema orientale]
MGHRASDCRLPKKKKNEANLVDDITKDVEDISLSTSLLDSIVHLRLRNTGGYQEISAIMTHNSQDLEWPRALIHINLRFGPNFKVLLDTHEYPEGEAVQLPRIVFSAGRSDLQQSLLSRPSTDSSSLKQSGASPRVPRRVLGSLDNPNNSHN